MIVGVLFREREEIIFLKYYIDHYYSLNLPDELFVAETPYKTTRRMKKNIMRISRESFLFVLFMSTSMILPVRETVGERERF